MALSDNQTHHGVCSDEACSFDKKTSDQFVILSEAYDIVASEWAASSASNDDPKKEAEFLHHVTDYSTEVLDADLSSNDHARRARFKDASSLVAAVNGRILFLGHAPAISTHDEGKAASESIDATMGAWAPDPRQAELQLLGFQSKNTSSNKSNTAEGLPGREVFPGGVCVIDNVFSPAALGSLRRLCDESTVFFDHKAGYFGVST